MPFTASDLFAVSTLLSTAVIDTVPVLVVALAAKVSVVFALRVKSLVVAGAVGVTVTVTVDWLDEAADRVPVTVVEPPFSPMLVEPSDSVTLGVPSSSVMVRVWLAGAVTACELEAVADTVTDLSAVSLLLSTAVIVTVPVLVVAPAAIVSVLFALRVKSAATAGDTGAADTVRVVAALEARLSVAVTVLTPAFSPMAAGLSTSVAVGVSSSSFTVTVAEPAVDDTE